MKEESKSEEAVEEQEEEKKNVHCQCPSGKG